MPQYQFRCDGCGTSYTVLSTTPSPCPGCGLTPHSQRRIWAFTVNQGLPEHFNQSLGQYVNNHRELRDGFKRASDEASARLGMDTDYQPLDPADLADPAEHGVTEEGLEETRRVTYTSD